MCGIAGVLATGTSSVDPRHLGLMAAALRHRGPDDEGYLLVEKDAWTAHEFRGKDTVIERGIGLPAVDDAQGGPYALGLAHRRLSIIDVSPAGHQPIGSANGRLWLTYNGEIYNYVELRQELEAAGHRFWSGSDTEVVLRAYEQWGEACVERFNGMWAFALADLSRRRLVCARDRLGVKPLYYWLDGARFVFASEIKALLRLPFVPRVPNDRIVWDFLVLGEVDHTEETFFDGIRALPAGHVLSISFDGRLASRPYWRLRDAAPDGDGGRPPSPRDTERVRDLLVDAVRLRLRSDVPVGFCLSGGLDSSSIVAAADRLLDEQRLPQVGDRLKAFHSAFDDARIDERAYAQAVIDRTRVSPAFVYPTTEEFLGDYEGLLRQQDEPFGGPSVYAQYRVIRLAREHGVKVLLDGQAGDELFGGYYHYFGPYVAGLLRAGRLAQTHAALRRNGGVIGRHALMHLALQGLPRPMARRVLIERGTEAELIDASFFGTHLGRLDGYLDQARRRRTVRDALADDLTRYSLPALLRYEDRNSMAFSLESRVPFADDPRLIELAFGLPDSARIWQGWTKHVLRQATEGLLPESVRWRTRKLGFSVPEDRWASALRGTAMWQALAETASRYLDQTSVRRFLAGDGPVKHRTMLWRVLELDMWERTLAASNPEAPRAAARVELNR